MRNIEDLAKYIVYVYHHVKQGKPVINRYFTNSAGSEQKLSVLFINDYNSDPEKYYASVWLENGFGNRLYERRFNLSKQEYSITAKELSDAVKGQC